MSDLRIKRLLTVALLSAISLGLAFAARYWLVEPAELSLACDMGLSEASCSLKSLVVSIFAHQRLGYFALAGAGLSLLAQTSIPAWVTLVAGCAGLVLYCADLSAPSTLIAALVLMKR